MEMSGQLHAPAALPPGKEPLFLLDRRLGGLLSFSTIKLYSNTRYESVSKSFRTGWLERELQMIHLSATGCSCIIILWVSLVSFAAITLCVASQRVFIVVTVYFVDSVRKLLDTPAYIPWIKYRYLPIHFITLYKTGPLTIVTKIYPDVLIHPRLIYTLSIINLMLFLSFLYT
jgi:hypothetical protein